MYRGHPGFTAVCVDADCPSPHNLQIFFDNYRELIQACDAALMGNEWAFDVMEKFIAEFYEKTGEKRPHS
jgi:hypothetical protein